MGFRLSHQLRNINPPPQQRGSRGYDFHYRVDEVNRKRRGDAVTASDRTLRCWQNERILPYAMNGNHAYHKIRGHDLFLLMLFRLVYPKASADEVRCFLYKKSRGLKLYSNLTYIYDGKASGFLNNGQSRVKWFAGKH